MEKYRGRSKELRTYISEEYMFMPTGKDLVKALMETPLKYKGEIVYITGISEDGRTVGIGDYPYTPSSAWHNPEKMEIAEGVKVKYFNGLEYLTSTSFASIYVDNYNYDVLTKSAVAELKKKLLALFKELTNDPSDMDDPQALEELIQTVEFEEGYATIMNNYNKA